jgi:hypothetical protein
MKNELNAYEPNHLDEEFDDRMGTVCNALGHFLGEVDVAFPDEPCNLSTRVRILASAMKSCHSKMVRSLMRKCTSEEIKWLNIFMFSERNN